MTTIGLIRHGITEWNHIGKAQGLTDIPLNEEGKQQAHLLANRLATEENWDIIVSSDLIRAKETAQIIATALHMPINSIDDRIREINLGLIEGTTEEERRVKWGENWRDIDLGMEKRQDVAKRGILFIEELALTYPGKRVLMVSHGALIGITLQHLLPEQFSKTIIENTALTILTKTDEKWTCSLYNCSGHLS